MDLKEQKAETEAIFRDFAAHHPLPDTARVEFHFRAEDETADWDGFAEAAEDDGYAIVIYDTEDDADAPYIEITSPEITLSAADLWQHEEALTLMAAIYGFLPDGWGFFAA